MGRLMSVIWCTPDDGSDAPLISQIAAIAVVFLLVSAIFWFAFSQLQYGWNWHAVWQYRHEVSAGVADHGTGLSRRSLSQPYY